jgi:hypothetical protein
MRGTLSSSTPAWLCEPPASTALLQRLVLAGPVLGVLHLFEGLPSGAAARQRPPCAARRAWARACFFAVGHAVCRCAARRRAAETRGVPMPRCPAESPERLSPPDFRFSPAGRKGAKDFRAARLSGLSDFRPPAAHTLRAGHEPQLAALHRARLHSSRMSAPVQPSSCSASDDRSNPGARRAPGPPGARSATCHAGRCENEA